MFIHEDTRKSAVSKLQSPPQSTTCFLQVNSITISQQRNGENVFVRILNKYNNPVQEANLFSIKDLENKNIKIHTETPQIHLCAYCRTNKRQQNYLVVIGSALLSKNYESAIIMNSAKKSIGKIKYKIKQVLNKVIQIKNIFLEDELHQLQSPLSNKMQNKDNELKNRKQKKFMSSNEKILELSDEYKHSIQQQKWNIYMNSKLKETEKLIDQSMKQSEDERLIFSKYLDQSTQFIQQLLNQMNEKKTIDKNKNNKLAHINEENDQIDSQTNYQSKKYLKANRKYLHYKHKYHKFKILSSAMETETLKKIKITQLQNTQNKQSLQCRQFNGVIDSYLKITQIKMSVKQPNSNNKTQLVKFQLKEQCQIQNVWPIKFTIMKQGALYINCRQKNNIELTGLVSQIQQKKGYCHLYDDIGNQKGMFYFKCKLISTLSVQTQQMIEQIQQNQCQNQVPPQKILLDKSIDCHIQQSYQNKQKQEQLRQKEQNLLKNDNALTVRKKIQQNKAEQAKNGIKNQMHASHSSSVHQTVKIKQMEMSNHSWLQASKDVTKRNDKSIQGFTGTFKLDLPSPSTKSQRNKRKTELQSDYSLIQSNAKMSKKQQQGNTVNNEQKSVNIRISQILVKLDHRNINKQNRFMKIQINNNSIPYFTQSIAENQLYCWRDRSYYFLKATQWALLTLQLLQGSNSSNKIAGTSKVYIISLIKNQQNGPNRYKTYLYDKKEDPIGQIAITYEFFERNSMGLRALSSRLTTKDKYQSIKKQKVQMQQEKKEKQIKSIKEILQPPIDQKVNNLPRVHRNNSNLSTQKSKPLQFQSAYLHRQLFKESSFKQPSQKSKYSGRNIIIPKQRRFKTTENKLFYDPSPLGSVFKNEVADNGEWKIK